MKTSGRSTAISAENNIQWTGGSRTCHASFFTCRSASRIWTDRHTRKQKAVSGKSREESDFTERERERESKQASSILEKPSALPRCFFVVVCSSVVIDFFLRTTVTPRNRNLENLHSPSASFAQGKISSFSFSKLFTWKRRGRGLQPKTYMNNRCSCSQCPLDTCPPHKECVSCKWTGSGFSSKAEEVDWKRVRATKWGALHCGIFILVVSKWATLFLPSWLDAFSFSLTTKQ